MDKVEAIKLAQTIDLSQFYWIIGAMVVSNLGVLWAVLQRSGKIIWFFATLKAQVDENTKDIDAAHAEIRSLKSFKNA